MKKMLAIGLVLFSAVTQAQEVRYVTDNLSTFLRTGPTDKYRTAGSLNAGDKVELLAVSEDERFSQIIDARGRTAWIESAVLTKIPSPRFLIPELEKKIQALTKQLNNSDNEWIKANAAVKQQLTDRTNQLSELGKENAQLKQQLATQQETIDSLNGHLDNERQDLIFQWFLYGGSVAGGGLLLGLILPKLIPRRRSKDRWMN